LVSFDFVCFLDLFRCFGFPVFPFPEVFLDSLRTLISFRFFVCFVSGFLVVLFGWFTDLVSTPQFPNWLLLDLATSAA
jgi:hypothetical protein